MWEVRGECLCGWGWGVWEVRGELEVRGECLCGCE